MKSINQLTMEIIIAKRWYGRPNDKGDADCIFKKKGICISHMH